MAWLLSVFDAAAFFLFARSKIFRAAARPQDGIRSVRVVGFSAIAQPFFGFTSGAFAAVVFFSPPSMLTVKNPERVSFCMATHLV